MEIDKARQELEDLIAKSINIADFAEFAKHQKKVEAAKVKLAYAEAREKAEQQRQKDEAEAAELAEKERNNRLMSKFSQRLEEHLSNDYDKTLDQLISTYQTGEALFKDVCNVDFNLQPDVIGLYRQEYHIHQFCRCLTTRGFRPIIDAIKNFHPGPLPHEVKMADYLGDAVTSADEQDGSK
jgi:hypothetical protein